MNTRALPLAAALALTASAARAQFADVLRDRAQPGADKYGICPPSDQSCQTGFMDEFAKKDPTQTIAAYDPPPGQKWASDTCRHVPCAIVPDPAQTQKEKTEIQGPPSMEAFDNGVLKGNLLRFPDGTVSYCFDDSCSTRLTPGEAKTYLDKKAADDANKKDFQGKDDKSKDKGDLETTAADTGPGKGAGDDTATTDRTSVNNNPGYEDGKSVASMFDIGGAGKIGQGDQDGPGGKSAPTNANGGSVIFVDGNAAVRQHDGFTFTKTARNAALLQQFRAKTSGAFAAGEAPDPDAETPLDPEPTRAAANDD